MFYAVATWIRDFLYQTGSDSLHFLKCDSVSPTFSRNPRAPSCQVCSWGENSGYVYDVTLPQET